MIYLLLVASVLLGTAKNTLSKSLSSMSSNASHIHITNFYTMLVAWILFVILNKGFSQLSLISLLVGIVYAAFSLISQIYLLKAMKIGPVAFTSLFFSCGFIISTILGAIVYHEQIRFIQVIGILVIIIAMYISISPGTMKNFSIKWLSYSLIAFLCAGIVGFFQKFHQKSSASSELNMMLIVAFGIMTLASLIFYLLSTEHDKAVIKSRKFLLSGLCLGLFIALQNKNNLYLAGVLPSAVFFPISNGGIIISSTVAASFLFHEKLSKIQKLGMLLGVIAIAIIGSC